MWERQYGNIVLDERYEHQNIIITPTREHYENMHIEEVKGLVSIDDFL